MWENLDLGRVYRPHCVRSVLTTSVKILPYRPPARLIRAKYYPVFKTVRVAEKINTIASIWGENMLGYLSFDIICPSKLKVFLELRSRKTVLSSKQIMSADKYPSIFLRQMEAIVYVFHRNFLSISAIKLYHTQTSHLATVFSMAWYKIVMSWYNHGIFHLSLVFSWFSHSPKGSCVYQKLLYLSVSTRTVIGQFCGPYFTVRPANFENFFFLRPINLRDIINILLTSFSRSVL